MKCDYCQEEIPLIEEKGKMPYRIMLTDKDAPNKNFCCDDCRDAYLDMIECATCGERIDVNSEAVSNTTHLNCGGEIK
jgi:hypothetical protein